MPLMRRGPGLLGTAARTAVVAGVAGRVQHRQQERWAGQAAAQQSQPAAQAPAGEADYVAELQRLAELRDRGVITDEDFEAKKKQLLGL
jgi:membrane protease subunit (stomatin/prohibitin family)